MESETIIIENTTIIGNEIKKGSVLLEDDKISNINQNLSSKDADIVISGEGKVLIPGLVNTHTHLSMTLLRGLADDLVLDTWLNEHIWPTEANLDGELCYVGAKLACAEIIQGLNNDINEIKKIIGGKPEKIHIYVAPDWKWNVLEIVNEIGKPNVGQIMGNSIKNNLHDDKKEIADYAKKIAKMMTKMNYVGKLDEYSIIEDSLAFLSKEADAEVIVYKDPTYDPEGKAGNATPYKPAIFMEISP